MWCKNNGAPFHRENGDVVEEGAVFDATDDEYLRMKYKLEPCSAPAWASPAEAWRQEWPMQMHPRLYLRLAPDGEHADLAQRILDEMKQEESDASENDSHRGS